jgi:hypothetical protein
VSSFTTKRIETVSGAIIPMMKYIILIANDPASSFSKRNEKK